ncbi:MAG: class I SAM-dependent methyltransferase [Chloroflexota bacterium]
MTALATSVTACRLCASVDLTMYLDLGKQPLANSFLSHPDKFEEEPLFPLEVLHCQRCGLSQLSLVVDPQAMFSDYLFVSGTATASREHARTLARSWQERFGLRTDRTILELASNDGVVLAEFKALGARVLGVDPARNLVEVARRNGVETIVEFFGRDVAEDIVSRQGQAAGILARNVLAHVADVHDFVSGMRTALAHDGVVLIEVPYLGDLFKNNEYDTIYHEHLSYFSLSTITRLLEQHELEIFDVRFIELNGGSMQVYAQHGKGPRATGSAVVDVLRAEAQSRVSDFSTAAAFAERVGVGRDRLNALLRELKQNGKIIAAYGAAAKGNTLLNYCQIGRQLLHGIADLNPLKQGLFSPGMHIPVVPPRTLREQRPDHVLILAWNYRREILQQLADLGEAGTRFIVPIPEVALA